MKQEGFWNEKIAIERWFLWVLMICTFFNALNGLTMIIGWLS